MEAVKLESLPRGSFPGVANLQIAQEALGTITVVTSCGTQHLLVHIGLCANLDALFDIFSVQVYIRVQERRTGLRAPRFAKRQERH